MRHSITSIAILMLCFAALSVSCTSSENDDYIAPTTEGTIGFSTALQSNNMPASRAHANGVIGSKEDFCQTGNTMGVYGYKYNAQDDSTLVFDNESVTCSRNGSDIDWYYTPLRYWDKQSDYTFIAYAPCTPTVSGLTVNQTGTNGDISLSLKKVPGFQLASSGYDIMVSQPVARSRNVADVVMFNFSHILSQLSVRYKLQTTLPVGHSVTVNSCSIAQIPASGDFKRSYSSATDVYQDVWSNVVIGASHHAIGSSDMLLSTTLAAYGQTALIIPYDYREGTLYPQLIYSYTVSIAGRNMVVNGTIDLRSAIQEMIASRGVVINIVIQYTGSELTDFDQLNPDAYATWWTVVGY